MANVAFLAFARIDVALAHGEAFAYCLPPS
jgi:hypothetical protein